MDPWYFLNISLEENNEDIYIHECTDYSWGGDWIIQSDKYKIIYENNKYDVVKYNNTTKQITFWKDDEALLNLQLIVKNEDKSDKNKINIIENIVDIIDDNKEKITDINYIKIMNFLQKEYISN
tara:strand:- start:119 stop:490 length:372 start_codon:yes stop_codon:yes gene_type:complete